MSNYWQIQLHPRHLEHFDDVQFNKAMEARIIGMKSGWNNDGGLTIIFRYDVAIGDIIMVRHKGVKALVQVVSDVYENNRTKDFWFDIVRNVKVLSMDGAMYQSKYNGDWAEGLDLKATLQLANNNKFIIYWANDVYKTFFREKSNEAIIINDCSSFWKQLKANLLTLFDEE